MATPLYDAVRKYIENTKVRTHTPGHSGKADTLCCFNDMLPFDVEV